MKKLLIVLCSTLPLLSCSDLGGSGGTTVTKPVPQASTDTSQPASPVSAATAAPSGTSPVIINTGAAINGMVFVSGGTFLMGSNDPEASNDEKPQHDVTLSSFYIGKYELTQKEYLELIRTNPSYAAGDDLPVEKVSWAEAAAFCNARSKKEGLAPAYNEKTGDLLDSSGNITTDISKVAGYRLPTEAEWEFAARGGNQSAGFKYSGSNDATEVAVFKIGKTAPVGSKKANELGIYDMSGNVWEWTTDWYKVYTKDAAVNPYVSQVSSFRVGRGGSWGDDIPSLVRVTDRNFDIAATRAPYLGFRLAKSL